MTAMVRTALSQNEVGTNKPSELQVLSYEKCSEIQVVFHPQPPSLPILLPEPGSERKVLAKET